MDLFDRTTKAVREVGNSIVDTIGNVTREQTEIANLKIQKAAIERKLESQYAEIGKRYITYIGDPFRTDPFDVADILDAMGPYLDKIAEIAEQMEQKEQHVRQSSMERDRKKAQEHFDSEKRKLDRAKDLDVLSEEEYAEKLAKAQKKLDNFEILKKVRMQYEMDIITREEYVEKVKKILE